MPHFYHCQIKTNMAMCKRCLRRGKKEEDRRKTGNEEFKQKKARVHVFHLCSRHILDQTVETIPSVTSYVRVSFHARP